MLLAETGLIMLAVLVFLLGLVGFVILGIATVWRVLKIMARAFTGNTRPTHYRAGGALPVPRTPCAHQGCSFTNLPEARFCRGCGRPLAARLGGRAHG